LHPERSQELSLRCPCFVAVFLSVKIQRRLNTYSASTCN
jgi:hypothetical protein